MAAAAWISVAFRQGSNCAQALEDRAGLRKGRLGIGLATEGDQAARRPQERMPFLDGMVNAAQRAAASR